MTQRELQRQQTLQTLLVKKVSEALSEISSNWDKIHEIEEKIGTCYNQSITSIGNFRKRLEKISTWNKRLLSFERPMIIEDLCQQKALGQGYLAEIDKQEMILEMELRDLRELQDEVEDVKGQLESVEGEIRGTEVDLRGIDEQIEELESQIQEDENDQYFNNEFPSTQKEVITQILSERPFTCLILSGSNYTFRNGILYDAHLQIGDTQSLKNFPLSKVSVHPFSTDSLPDYLCDQLKLYTQFYLTVQMTADATQRAIKKKSFGASNNDERQLSLVFINMQRVQQLAICEYILSTGYQILDKLIHSESLSTITFSKSLQRIRLLFIDTDVKLLIERALQSMLDALSNKSCEMEFVEGYISELVKKKGMLSIYMVDTATPSEQCISFLSQIGRLKVAKSRQIYLNQY
ncbi:hypothetical protein FGO68_gene17635 [Halteria grandinella]|uniref:Uncharacterized protein n=1 Tax=Halteria grandinella TaxID=5974 RepID=A0A8J8NDQ6_HALGN|nr:hypothetical protein FGO68_gene17635 [Halteria grandinella]